MRAKYPSTPHLPFSPGLQNDDRLIQTLSELEGSDVVVTEKMDGENTTMYNDHIHARSLDSRNHSSRNWVKKLWGNVAYQIPEGWRVCGENLYAQHSITYDDLVSYFYAFSVWDSNNVALGWDDTVRFLDTLGMTGLHHVPVLYRGIFDLKVLKDLSKSINRERVEGFVVRVSDPVPYDEFDLKFAKWVRKGHVQTSDHWAHQIIIPNKLRNSE